MLIIDIKGPSTYLVRVPGNSRRFVHADHLIPDDSCVGRNNDLCKDNEITECCKGCTFA